MVSHDTTVYSYTMSYKKSVDQNNNIFGIYCNINNADH